MRALPFHRTVLRLLSVPFLNGARSHLLNTVVVRTRPQTQSAGRAAGAPHPQGAGHLHLHRSESGHRGVMEEMLNEARALGSVNDAGEAQARPGLMQSSSSPTESPATSVGGAGVTAGPG